MILNWVVVLVSLRRSSLNKDLKLWRLATSGGTFHTEDTTLQRPRGRSIHVVTGDKKSNQMTGVDELG